MTTNDHDDDLGEHVDDPAELLREHRGEATGNEGAPDDGHVADPGELLAAHRGETGQPSGRAYGGPALPSRLDLRKLLTRPPHEALDVPEPVARSWAAVEEAADGLVAARTARQAVDEAEQAERADEVRRVREAVAAGKSATPKPATRDFDTERRHADAIIAGSEDRARRARAAYDELVTDCAASWAASVSASLAERHSRAVEAVRQSEVEVGGLRAAVAAVVGLQPDHDPVELPSSVPAARALNDVAGWLVAVQQPCETGVVVEPRVEPSRAWRRSVDRQQRQAVGVIADFRELARTERQEAYSITSYTRGVDERLLGAPPAAAWVPT